MCSPYFRQFPELPAELRLQIWQEACLAFPPSHRGLHYVTVQDNAAVALPCSWPTWPRSLSHGINRSAYFINGGLWKACKESREVIAKHTDYYQWHEIHTQAIQDSRELVHRQPRLGHRPPPAIVDHNGEGGEECRMLISPTRDMFCLKVDDWHSICEGLHPDIKMPFMHFNYDDASYAQLVLYHRYQSLFKQPELQDIALEFDPSWITDIPDFYLDMKWENSARGYLVCWIYENARLYGESLSIIDKEAKWFAKGSVETIYRDFDTEYVRIGWDDVADSTYEPRSSSAAAFMNKIRHYENDIYPEPEIYDGWLGPWGPYFEDVIGLIVRRDNEVKEPIWSCPGKCDRNRWCICSGDKTKRRQEQEDPDASQRHLMERVSLRNWSNCI